jgi:hypothetical protein
MRKSVCEQTALASPANCFARLDRIGLAGLSLALLILAGSASSTAAGPGCSQMVTACGCSITSGGVYIVAQDLVSTRSNGDCVTIVTKNVVLNLDGHSLTGPGNSSNGSGIRIKASSVWVEGQGMAAQRAEITGWRYGIENEGKEVFVENVSATGNAKAGIVFLKATDSKIVNFDTSSNSGYGVWLSSGDDNQIGTGTASHNVLDGILVGCAVSARGTCASGGGKSQSSTIYGITANTNGLGGITVQFDSDFNQIGNCSASGNSNGDLNDGGAGASCAHNLWFADTGTVNKACVQ